jgi:hypothetical protein
MPIHQFMLPELEQLHETLAYVSVPPALTITDESNTVWTLGFNSTGERGVSRGEFCYDVLRNGMPVGEFANRIERRGKHIRIFGPQGWKRWTGRSFI